MCLESEIRQQLSAQFGQEPSTTLTIWRPSRLLMLLYARSSRFLEYLLGERQVIIAFMNSYLNSTPSCISKDTSYKCSEHPHSFYLCSSWRHRQDELTFTLFFGKSLTVSNFFIASTLSALPSLSPHYSGHIHRSRLRDRSKTTFFTSSSIRLFTALTTSLVVTVTAALMGPNCD